VDGIVSEVSDGGRIIVKEMRERERDAGKGGAGRPR
jgi:hypothetical protein